VLLRHLLVNTDRRWYLLALLGLAFLMTTLDSTIMIAALPSVTADLRLSPSAAQWTITSDAITFGGLLLLCGRAADLFGRRRMFLVGVALRIAAAATCGLAPSGGVLIAGRLLLGLSAAVVAPAALSMVTTTFAEGPERNRALGIWGGLGGVGATAGLLAGGAVTVALGWPWVFFLNVPICLFVLVAGPALLPSDARERRTGSFDAAGAAVITAALALLIYAVISVPSAGWLSLRTIGSLLAVAGLVVAFVRVEARSAAPLVPLRVFRSRSLAGGNLLVLAAGMAVDGMLVTLTGYVQQGLGWSAARFGLLAALMTVTSVGGVWLSQRLVSRYGLARVAASGTILLAIACLLLSTVSVAVLIAGLVVFGVGLGGSFVAAQIAGFAGVPERDSGLAAGLIDTTFTTGSALGIAICTSVALTAGYRAAFASAAVFAAFGLVTALTLLRRTDKPAEVVVPAY
jgi:MFS family permease